ncbi:hypothetical protein GF352_03655 [archaeon]|nr:hypothetical protein [archaeon]
MGADGLVKRLDDFIEKFDDNLVESSKTMFIPDHYLPTGVLDLRGVMLEKEGVVKLHELGYEAFQEWKDLFKEYKKLKDKVISNDFTDKFYSFTNKKMLSLFNPLILNRVREFAEWVRYKQVI